RLAGGSYSITASRVGYLTPDTVVFQHGAVDDTVYVYMRPEPVFSATVYDAKSGRRVYAKVDIVDKENGQTVYTTTLDSLQAVASTKLDLNKRYTVSASAPGYMDLTEDVVDVDNEMTLTMDPIEPGKKYVLENMFFATNETTILPTSDASLQGLYDMLNENPDVRIKIIGHTDNVGSDRSNQILSEGRAKSVRQSMIDRGIAADRIEAEGRGESEPIDSNYTEAGRQRNRRVEVEVLSASSTNRNIFSHDDGMDDDDQSDLSE
ncbi:MAG: OmpA family protein, partial [Paludibacteraceae bacterium]|nr:OmpA family protein [Paludibacteraceae bacterium]